MKKIIMMLTLALALAGAAPAQAQQATFKPHWYVQPQAGISWTMGEAKLDKLLSPAAQLTLGRQLSPLFGLRLGASGWQGRNWQVSPAKEYKWKHLQASLDATLSLTNLLRGYDADRRWNAYAFIGAGLNIAFDNDEANQLAAGHPVEFSKAWDGTCYSPAVRGGLGVEYALSERVALGLEANMNMLADKWNSKPGSDVDWQNHLLVGVKIGLGKTQERDAAELEVPAAEPEVPAVKLEAPAVSTAGEGATAEEEPVPEVPAAEPAAPAVSMAGEGATAEEESVPEQKPAEADPAQKADSEVKIYFGFNSSRISRQEAEKVREMARYLRSHRDSKVNVKGYASTEGRSSYNKALSGWRAAAVKQCLVSYGVNASRITTEAMGEADMGSREESRSAISIIIE